MINIKFIFSFILLFYVESIISEEWTEIIDLPNGQVRGQVLTTEKGTKYNSFKGIPYAAPPIGNLRFESPTEAENWEGVLNATYEDKICYRLLDNFEPNTTQGFTEDCLYLSVYVPVISSNKCVDEDLPVMFWIYGGAFYAGSYQSSRFGPDYFMDHGVILVTFNYRLGVFGFLATEDMISPGNAGLKDQLLALKWVNQNINLFGGDCNKITLFGESAGAVSIAHHLNSPLTKDLFRAAILQSGSALQPTGYVRNPKEMAYRTAAYANTSISEDNTSTEELVSYFKSLAPTELAKASQALLDEIGPEHILALDGLYYGPVIEPNHPNAIINESMYEIISSGRSSRVPIMIGITSEEGIGDAGDTENFNKFLETWDSNVSRLVPLSMNIPTELEKRVIGHFIKFAYCGHKDFVDYVGCGVRYFSDQFVTRGTIQHAALQSAYSNVYFYQFSYDGPLGMINVIIDGAETVGHAEDVNYLFKMNGTNLNDFPESDILTHNRLLTLWTNFAKYMNPTFEDPEHILQDIAWPNFHRQTYLDIGENLTIKHRPRKESFAFWKFLFEVLGVPPFITY